MTYAPPPSKECLHFKVCQVKEGSLLAGQALI